jgi:peptide/nickel transport system permease protein
MSMPKKVIYGGCGLLLIVVICMGVPEIISMDSQSITIDQRLLPPSLYHPFGTDVLGRSQLARVLMGGRLTLQVTLFAVIASSGIGVVVGLISGYCGRVVDNVICWIIDTLLAFPTMILALGIAGMLGPSLKNVILSVILVHWVSYAKVTRSLVQSIKGKAFVKIARLSHANHIDIFRKHMFKHLISPIVVMMSMDVGAMMLRIAALSFLGLGATAMEAEWGMMIQESRRYLQQAPWLFAFPSLAMVLTVTCSNLLGEGLRQLNDPRRIT